MAKSLMLVNPRKRRKAPVKRKAARKTVARKSPVKRKRNPASPVRRRRRNPASRKVGVKSIMGNVQNSAIGAAGAVGVDMAMRFLPIPLNLRMGNMNSLTKGVVALGLGMLTNAVVKGNTGTKIAEGGMTVALYEAASGMIAQQTGVIAPGGVAGSYSDLDNAAMAEYLDAGEGMGEYLDGGMGYAGAGEVLIDEWDMMS